MDRSWHDANKLIKLLSSFCFFAVVVLAFAATSAFGQTVQITNSSRGGSVLYVGDYYLVTVTGPANASVTVTFGGWTGNMGSTDANGNFALSGQAGSVDVGLWEEYWAVNGSPAYPYPLTFYVYETPPQQQPTPVVSITNTSRGGTSFYPGDTYSLSITGGAPYAPVTCTIGSWTGSMGTTDWNGSYSLTGTMTSSDVGQWVEYWIVNNIAAQPYPLTFLVSESPYKVTSYTDIAFDPTRFVIQAFSHTSWDYGTSIYYQVSTGTRIVGNGNTVTPSYSQTSGVSGGFDTYVEAPANGGWQYQAFSDTYLNINYVTYQYDYVTGQYYTWFYDPYGYWYEGNPDIYTIGVVVWAARIITAYVVSQVIDMGGTASNTIEAPRRILSSTTYVASGNTDRGRTTIGLGEAVHLWIDQPASATWSSTCGSATLNKLGGIETTFTAPKSPGPCTIFGYPYGSKTFTVVAPSGISVTGSTNMPLGELGPPSNRIGARTLFNYQVTPTTVSFKNVNFRENMPGENWTWPDGTSGTKPGGPLTWHVNEDNTGIDPDDISTGVNSSSVLYNGSVYVGIPITIRVPEEYQKDDGQWVSFLPGETHVRDYRANLQTRVIMNVTNTAYGSFQGPYR